MLPSVAIRIETTAIDLVERADPYLQAATHTCSMPPTSYSQRRIRITRLSASRLNVPIVRERTLALSPRAPPRFSQKSSYRTWETLRS